jgi:hypothetical protein
VWPLATLGVDHWIGLLLLIALTTFEVVSADLKLPVTVYASMHPRPATGTGG